MGELGHLGTAARQSLEAGSQHGESERPESRAEIARFVGEASGTDGNVREEYEIQSPTPGTYKVRASVTLGDPRTGKLRVVTSPERTLIVYRGDGSVEVRRRHLRVVAESVLTAGGPSSFQKFRAYMLELQRISPDDPGIFERLADVSVDKLPPDETLSYYQSALRMAERNVENRFGENVQPIVLAELNAQRRKVADFESRIPYYRAHFEEVGLFIIRVGGRDQFVWFKRPNGPVLRNDALPKYAVQPTDGRSVGQLRVGGMAPRLHDRYPPRMLSDLDALLEERGIDAAIVPMHEAMHPSFRWLTRGAKVTRGYAIKRPGEEPVLVTYPMEREEAAATGLKVRLVHEFDQDRIFKSAPNPAEAYGEMFTLIFRDLGIAESVAFFGNAPVQLYVGVVEALERRGWRVHRSNGEDLIQLARKRKEEWEVEAVRDVGERTEQVVDGVRRMLRGWKNGMTLGELKQFVSAEIARLGMIEDHETILSQGRHAGVPHSRGDASAVIRPSLPIVLDIFPSDKTSGYFFDLTRTFCVGPIPDELRRMHAEVYEAFTRARDAMRPGTPASSYQALVCDYFEAKGYATLRSDPTTQSGYVHGLGHGVGLEIHEKPSFALNPTNRDLVETGDILTIEPGLYFPEREIGIRIEDTFVVREDGVETLCRGAYGLEP